MTTEAKTLRYEMVNVRTGYLIIEQESHSLAKRSYFVAEAHPPWEEYRQGTDFWKPLDAAQTFQFDVRDNRTGEVVSCRELVGLLYYACCDPGSDVYRMGEVAHEARISVYVAISADEQGQGTCLGWEKVRVLNALFNERIQSPDKKVLILPDLFGLHRQMSYGQIAIDFGLTSMESGVPA